MKKVGLFLASTIWSILNEFVYLLQSARVLRPTKLPCRVISIGNIQAGGSGKTPLVIQIGKEALSRGLRTCVLTRGYRGEWEKTGGVLLPGLENVSAQAVGDEAALVYTQLPGVFLGIGANRVRQFHRITEKTKIDVVILDDGFQSWKIHKDTEVLALTDKKFGEILFRNFPWRKKKANLGVWTKGKHSPLRGVKFSARVVYRLERSLFSDPCWLVMGVADPQSVLESVTEAGYQVTRTFVYSDHAIYHKNQVMEILEAASREGTRIILTGKDWVKWKELGVGSEQVIRLEPRLEFLEGRQIWDQILWQSS